MWVKMTKIKPPKSEEDILQFWLKCLFYATFVWEIKEISRLLFYEQKDSVFNR
jgi:hypothetical protein